jgi:hypothetical protein
MFRCALTKELSNPTERPYTLVIEKRLKTYFNEQGKESQGWEVVEEIKIRESNLEKAKKKFGIRDESQD